MSLLVFDDCPLHPLDERREASDISKWMAIRSPMSGRFTSAHHICLRTVSLLGILLHGVTPVQTMRPDFKGQVVHVELEFAQ